ncbi:hypothetical protein I350_00713 [Cryptococcus amylolentus CBS 6273]|uniref:NADH:ubiquinone oxidoreductase intermediate-associated protein 30 domain-containing protein n=1 Tax=Cryptococcus amylolentus CBS 6273 TaxID=1296118 RepID=A0A1E3KFR5_9TREE|nr:hypothetical protein I350_00713 [Cryptococcus amylolentus CBS 6273]
MFPKDHPLFPPFHFHKWRAVDDRVRGGSSVSHLDPVKIDVHGHVSSVAQDEIEEMEKKGHGGKDHLAGRFWGNLDIRTLGGAGFASQAFRYGPAPLHFPRHKYSGISITALTDPLQSVDEKHPHPENFTFVLKTSPTAHIPKHPKTPAPPRAAQLTYQVEFNISHGGASTRTPGEKKFTFPWGEFKATYRGREIKKGDPQWVPLDTSSIYEVSLMCRSDFGQQEGDFGVIVTDISAVEKGQEEEDEDEGCWSGVVGWFKWAIGAERGIRLEEDEDELCEKA